VLTRGRTATPQTVASTVSTVRRGTVAVTASAAGTVQASATRGLSFSVAGTVTEVDVHAGDTVTAGQVLARIDNSDAQTQLASAQDALTSAQNALTTAQQSPSPTPTQAAAGCVAPAAYPVNTGWTSASPSPSPSPSGSPSPSPSPSPTGHGTPTATTGPTRTANPTPTSGRTGGSGGSGGAGGSGSCRAAGGSGSGTGTGGSGTTGGGNRSSGGDALFSAQQQVNNAQLALQQAQRRLDGTVITAPVAGKVLSVAGTVGGAETPGSTGFIVLGGVNDTEVTGMFTETDVAHLAVGQSATITLPDRAGQQYPGTVSQVSPTGTTSGRLVRYAVLIAFNQVPADLLFGQSANVAVTTQSVSNVLYVSSSALTPGANSTGTGTVTVRSGGHDQSRTVQIGLRGDQYTEIRSGLSEGESVVTGGR
jgi:multidrug efflux pump subunit AcrA (membrane-fusion protein)